jgi:transposase InsO family protein
MDRDKKYSREFRSQLRRDGVRSIRCPPRAPNCNAFAERFVRSVKEECLDRQILFGERSLRTVIKEYMFHYNAERNHQGVNNQLLTPLASVNTLDPIQCRERLGGTLKYYYRAAA